MARRRWLVMVCGPMSATYRTTFGRSLSPSRIATAGRRRGRRPAGTRTAPTGGRLGVVADQAGSDGQPADRAPDHGQQPALSVGCQAVEMLVLERLVAVAEQ